MGLKSLRDDLSYILWRGLKSAPKDNVVLGKNCLRQKFSFIPMTETIGWGCNLFKLFQNRWLKPSARDATYSSISFPPKLICAIRGGKIRVNPRNPWLKIHRPPASCATRGCITANQRGGTAASSIIPGYPVGICGASSWCRNTWYFRAGCAW